MDAQAIIRNQIGDFVIQLAVAQETIQNLQAKIVQLEKEASAKTE